MKLAAKTAVVFIAAFCIALALYGRYETKRQTEGYETELRQAQRALGRLFRPTIARTWRNEGAASAMYLIEYTEQTLREQDIQSRMTLRWVWLDEESKASHAPAVPAEQLGIVRDGEELTVTSADEWGVRRMYSYVPLVVGIEDERPGALEVSASMAPLREFSEHTQRMMITAVLVLAGVCAVLAVAVGAWLVGRPINRLVEAAHRIGAGELDTRVDVRQKDELGTLGREMNRMAESLSLARERLAVEAEQRIQALEQMRHADRLATVGQLASGIAHELGTPLAVISGRAELIANRTATGDAAVEYAQSVQRQADRMASIIRQLLDFARRRKVTRSPTDMRAIVRQTVELLQSLAMKHRVTVTTELPENEVKALVDGTQIHQVLMNLVVNAIHSMPEGGQVTVGVSVREATPPADVAAEPGSYVCMWVRDYGLGIPDDIRSRIFEPFFTTKPVGQGTGLGLSVSYGIASDHGGWIDVDSREGEGAEFRVMLPAS